MNCKKCNSDNIKIVEDRKAKWNYPAWVIPLLYVGVGIIILTSFGLLFINILTALITFFSLLAIYSFFIFCLFHYRKSRNSKTRTKCICKDCGNIWYLNWKLYKYIYLYTLLKQAFFKLKATIRETTSTAAPCRFSRALSLYPLARHFLLRETA